MNLQPQKWFVLLSIYSIRIKGLIEIRLKKPKKDFVVPDNIEDFDIRDYV